jgi:glutaredoxin 2
MCAAWDSYIKFSNVYDNVFQLLRDKYLWAIERMKMIEREGHGKDVDRQIARHLIIMFTREVLSPADELWKKFWEDAPDQIRKEAIEFIGRILRDRSNIFKEEVVKKFCDLFEDRLKKIECIDKKDQSIEEFTAFGWWFESEVIEEEWLLEQLERALTLTKGRIDWDHKVAERLDIMFEKHPKKVLLVLRKMCDGDYEGWSMISNKGVYENVLRKALKSENGEISSCADDFVNHLGAMGYQEFRELADVG